MGLLRVAPGRVADLLLPLYTKANVNSGEPLGFKGGWQVDIFKSGNAAPITCCRGIMLGTHRAK
eukprot:7744913-Pyramimonas_sp.AAC.1